MRAKAASLPLLLAVATALHAVWAAPGVGRGVADSADARVTGAQLQPSRVRRDGDDSRGARSLPSVKVLLLPTVTNDVFFRVVFFRHVLFGRFPDVSFEVLPQGGAASWRGRVVAAAADRSARVLVAGLKGTLCSDSFVQGVLGAGGGGDAAAWPAGTRVGLVVIDDEDYTDCAHSRSNATGNVGLVLRNYHHPKRVSDRVLYFPLGWRTTDGGFFEDHGSYFTPEYLDSQSGSPHTRVAMPDTAPASARPYHTFFVGTIRKGGRADMESEVREIARVRTEGGWDTTYALCTSADDVVNPKPPRTVTLSRGLVHTEVTVHACTDVLLASSKFLGNDLNVSSYYDALNRSRFALVPCGVNPESYRLWEVLHAGAIPIVETCGDPAVHPFAALPGALDVLPSLWSWRRLPELLAELDADPRGLDVLQRRIRRWFVHRMDRAIDSVTRHVVEDLGPSR